MANSAVASWMARNRHSAELLGPEPQPNPRPAQPSGVQRTFSGHVDTIETVAISNDGTKGASAGCDKSIFLWDLAVGRLLRRLDGHSASASAHGIVSKVAFAPDGTQLVSCGYDGAVRVWDVASGKQTRALTGHIRPITGLSMGGRQLLTAGADRSLRCWDLDGFRQQVVVETHPSSIAAATMTKDGALLLTGGKD